MKKLAFLAFLIWPIFAPPVAQAAQYVFPDTNSFRTDKIKGGDYVQVPDIFASYLNANVSPEEFVLRYISILKQAASDGMSVTYNDMKNAQEDFLRRQRLQRLRNLLEYDLNFDSQVTFQEIQQLFQRKNKNRNLEGTARLAHIQREDPVNELRVYDSNNDGILSYQEMSSENDPHKGREQRNNDSVIENILALDPNKDGRVTAEEITVLARNAYNIVDTNKNGMISEFEQNAYQEALRTKKIHERDSSVTPKCEVPFISNDTRLIIVDSHQGSYVSSVTTVGQTGGFTGAAEISVKKQNKPLQIILLSNNPIIYNFIEGGEYINHVYLISTHEKLQPSKDQDADISANGIINLSKEKITFLTRDCKQNLEKWLGGPANNNSRQQSFKKVTIYKDRVEYDPWIKGSAGAPAQPEFDKDLWDYAIKFYPAGIMNIDPTQVISHRIAEKYEILPNLFGIAKLVYEGKLEKTSDPSVLRIVSPITYFPSGLKGGVSKNFILEKGIPMPAGNHGHSCIMRPNNDGVLVAANRNCH